MDSFYGVATGFSGSRGKLNGFQFVMILSILSGIPFGMEYLISNGAITGYVLLFGVALSLLFILPFTLILSEMSSLVPSNHGAVGYVYRGFHALSPKLADFVGFINALNILFLYCIRLGLTPIIFEQYLQTYISVELNYWQSYLVMLAVIVSGFLFGLLNVHFTTMVISVVVLLALVPLLIGFFMATPQMSLQNSLVGTCSDDLDLSAFVVSFTSFFGFAYILIGNMIGELRPSAHSRLPYLFAAAVVISQCMYFVPFIATSTVYPSCESWREGLFASAYGEIWTPLYYAIEISSIVCNYVIYVITVILCGRMIWGMSQKYLLINRLTGHLVLEETDYEAIAKEYRQSTMDPRGHRNVYSTYFDSDSDEEGQDVMMADDQMQHTDDEHYRIKIRILPKFINKIWDRTRAPIWGILLQAVISAIICFVSSNYHIWTEFLMFMYLLSFLLIVCAFLILKHKEDDHDLIRDYKVPGGKCGAWFVAVLCCCCIVGIGLYLVREKWEMFLIAVGFNICFVVYYIIWRVFRCCFKRAKIVFRAKSSAGKDDALRVENEDFEHSISDTIPLL